MFENSKIVPDLEKSLYLAHYKPRNRGGDDKLSSYLLSFKDGDEDAVGNWVQFASDEFNKSKLQYDIIIRALGSNEVLYKTGQPLDALGEEIAKVTKAKYTPQVCGVRPIRFI